MTRSPSLLLFFTAVDIVRPIVVGASDAITAFESRSELKNAVDQYCADAFTDVSTYGHIENWDVSKITDMHKMFYDKQTCNPDISAWDVSNVQSFNKMFEYASAFNQDIGPWDVKSCKNFSKMFAVATNFNKDISTWNVSSGTNFEYMFAIATSFNQDVSSWDVSSSTNFEGMFADAVNFNQDISNWDVSNSATNFNEMLINAASFDQPNLYCKWSDKNSNFEDSSPQFCFGSIDCGWGDICNTPDDSAHTSSPLNARIFGDPIFVMPPAPDGDWELWFNSNVTVDNVDNSLDAEISQSIIMSSRAFNVTYYDYDCVYLLAHSISQENYILNEFGGGLSEIVSFATLNSAEVFFGDRDGIYDGDENGGNIAFCIRVDIFLDDKITSVNFVEKKVNMTVDLATATFSIVGIDVNETDAQEEDINKPDFSEFVEAYQCDPSIVDDQAYQGTYSQGSVLNICVTSTNSAIDVDTITELTVFQGYVPSPYFNTHPYILFPGSFNTQIVKLDCDNYTSLNGMRVCVAELNLLSKFFIESDPLDLRVDGKLKFVTDAAIGDGTSRSRLLQDSSKTGSFEVNVNVHPSSTTSKATKAGTMPLVYGGIIGGITSVFALNWM